MERRTTRLLILCTLVLAGCGKYFGKSAADAEKPGEPPATGQADAKTKPGEKASAAAKPADPAAASKTDRAKQPPAKPSGPAAERKQPELAAPQTTASAAKPSANPAAVTKPDPAPAAKKQPPAPNDARRIQGDWLLVESQENGQATPGDVQTHFVFSDREVKISGARDGILYQYTLDPTQDPCHIDLRLPGTPESLLAGIYGFQEDLLFLCLPTVFAPDGALRPNGFETKADDQRRTSVLKRAPQPASDAAKSLAGDPEDETLQELRQCLAAGVKLLESGKYADFLQQFMSPKNLASIAPDREALDKLIEGHFKNIAKPIAGALRATNRKIPKFNEDKTLAVFDMRDIHIDGAPPKVELRMGKFGDQWRILEDNE